jgi:hypothetical protein
VAFDLLFEATVPALEEPKSFNRTRARITQDVSRYAQVGSLAASSRSPGSTTSSTRDLEGRARPLVGGAAGRRARAPGIKWKDMANRTMGLLHNWLPMQFDDYMIKVSLDEDCDGKIMQQESVKVWNFGIDKPNEDMGRPEIETHLLSGHARDREVGR